MTKTDFFLIWLAVVLGVPGGLAFSTVATIGFIAFRDWMEDRRIKRAIRDREWAEWSAKPPPPPKDWDPGDRNDEDYQRTRPAGVPEEMDIRQ